MDLVIMKECSIPFHECKGKRNTNHLIDQRRLLVNTWHGRIPRNCLCGEMSGLVIISTRATFIAVAHTTRLEPKHLGFVLELRNLVRGEQVTNLRYMNIKSKEGFIF